MRELSTNQQECAALITALIEGGLSKAQRDRLNDLCRQDPGCRQLYIAVMSVHGMLLWQSDLSAQQEEEMDESGAFLMEIYNQARINRIKLDAELELAKDLKAQAAEARKRRQQREAAETESRARVIIIPKLVAYGGLAAAILLAVALLWPAAQTERPAQDPFGGPEVAEAVLPEARLVRARDAVWGQAIPPDGVLTGTGGWSLKEGFAEIAMPSGASVILHGPISFQLIDDNTLALDQGRLTAEVPDRAKYFTVKTPAMDVVDLGTRFGVLIEPDGGASTSVFEGEVEVHEVASDDASAPRQVALTAGQQLHADADGRLAESVTVVEPDHGYVAHWDAIDRWVGVEGQARFYNTPPGSVRQGELVSTDHLVVFEESTAVLEQPLIASINLPASATATRVTIPAGRRVVSYFLHYEPKEKGQVSATLQFPGRVLGVIAGVKKLRLSNGLLGLETTDYIPETRDIDHGIDARTADTFAIGGPRGDLLTIHLEADNYADQARVLVELPSLSGAEPQD